MRRTAAFGLALVALAACKGEGSGPVLAKGKGFEVTADEFRALVDSQMPFQRAQLATPGKKAALLGRMVEEEVLYARAKDEGLLTDPQVQRVLRSVMVQRLKAKRQAQPTDPATIPAADVERYYNEHPADFEKRVGAAIVAFYAAPDSPQRAQKRAAAERALASLRDAERKAAVPAKVAPQPASTRPPRGPAPAAAPTLSVAAVFTKLVAEASDDDATKRFGGSLGFRTRAELEQAQPPELAAAVFALPQGAISDVIETPKGFYIARVNAVREQVALDQARPHIQMRLARTQDEKAWTDFVKQVQADAKVEVDEKAVEALTLSAPPAEGDARPMPPAHAHPAMGGAGAPPPSQPPAETK